VRRFRCNRKFELYSDSNERGIYKTTDGGITQKEFFIDAKQVVQI
jgi:hypothetical protein